MLRGGEGGEVYTEWEERIMGGGGERGGRKKHKETSKTAEKICTSVREEDRQTTKTILSFQTDRFEGPAVG